MEALFEFLIRHGYAFLFIWVLIEQLGLPLPSAPLLLAAGALAASGRLSLALVLGLPLVAAVGADLLWYEIGRRRGCRVLHTLCRISLDPDACVRQTKEIFGRHGSRSLLGAKFIPGLGTVTPPLAGIMGMSLSTFLLFDGIGALLWVGVFSGLGFQFGHQIERITANMSALSHWAGGVAAAGLGAYIAWKYVQRRRFYHFLAVARVTPDEVKAMIDTSEEIVILDVRNPFELENEPRTLPGALHIPLQHLDEHHHRIPRDRDVVLCCNCPSEMSSARAALLLKQKGIIRVRPLAGGLRAWFERFPAESIGLQAAPGG
jgi:membrane protein DedA with SNARE-associated domain/rhodanese-related sulfurtransferase